MCLMDVYLLGKQAPKNWNHISPCFTHHEGGTSQLFSCTQHKLRLSDPWAHCPELKQHWAFSGQQSKLIPAGTSQRAGADTLAHTRSAMKMWVTVSGHGSKFVFLSKLPESQRLSGLRASYSIAFSVSAESRNCGVCPTCWLFIRL